MKLRLYIFIIIGIVSCKNPDFYIRKASQYKQQQNFNDALSIYNKGIKKHPYCQELYNNRGVVYSEIGYYQEAIDDFNFSIKLDSNYRLPYLNRIEVFRCIEDSEFIVFEFNDIINRFPGDYEVYYLRGKNYFCLDSLSLALKDFNQSLKSYNKIDNDKRDSDFANKIYSDIAEIYYLQDSFTNALELYEIDLKINGFNSMAYSQVGTCYLKLKDYNNAEVVFSELIEMQNSVWEFYLNRGLARRYQGKNELALEDYNHAILIADTIPIIYYNRGIVYFDLGKIDLACNDFYNALNFGMKINIDELDRMCNSFENISLSE